jgi:BioD-like phosphotransacetylase family protein
MATTIYVISTQRFSGKTALCVGLLNWFQRQGFAVGYMKPISTAARAIHNQIVDEDAVFIKTTFNLPDPLEIMTPILLTDQEVEAVLDGADVQDFETRALGAYHAVARDKDIMVFEGGASLLEGWIINLAPPHLSKMLGTNELVVVPYIGSLQVVDDLLTARLRLGKSMLGGVINSVPKNRLSFVQEKIKAFVERHDIPILAILPKDQVLMSVSVEELRDGLGGEVLCARHALNELVEHLMVGAMSAESALTYFRRESNMAVVTGGDRPDIQLAALETSTRCLILTGNLRPSPLIIGRAEERGVPIILTHHDTLTAIEVIENFFGKTRFHQEKKVRHFEELLDKYLDFGALCKALEISTKPIKSGI